PSEQRHIMRIILMIPIYAVISFLSYRFYKESIYYETIRDCYEAFVIYSFFILLLTYLGDDNETQRSKITGPDRRRLLYPLNCFYFNPLHEYFLYYMKYGILQYVAIKPATTMAAVVLQYFGLYCETQYDFHFGMIYLTIINFTSVSVALYCLFLCVKMVVFFCYWQTLLLSLLGAMGLFTPENNWSVLNVEQGISSILICSEMVVFAILHVYSFSYLPYVIPGTETPLRKSFIDGFNPIDMVRELLWACRDTVLMFQGKPIPIREGHLSGRLERAHTIRIKRRHRFFKSRKPAATAPISPEPVSPQAAGGSQTPLSPDDQARAPLLGHADRPNYLSTSIV
ncbi:hypothetical protein BGW38_005406, partial [Lunasporangiospora selenospora]